MNAKELCFWLQGYFELSAEKATFTMNVATVDIIKAHHRLVSKVEPRYRNLFLDWLIMRLASIDTSDKADATKVALNKDDMDQIRDYLAAQFRPDIDLSYGGDTKDLQATHDGSKAKVTVPSGGVELPYGPGYRC